MDNAEAQRQFSAYSVDSASKLVSLAFESKNKDIVFQTFKSLSKALDSDLVLQKIRDDLRDFRSKVDSIEMLFPKDAAV